MHSRFAHFLLIAFLSALPLAAQATKSADVYPSNLDSNMYFDRYDDATKTISGINFLVLADGDNSRDRTPAFTIKLYLLVPGGNVPIFVGTFEADGISHMGSLEYKDESVDLSRVEGLKSGTYRLGVYVDADNSIKEPDEGNNATLFRGEIAYTSGPARASQPDSGKKASVPDDSSSGPGDASEDSGEEYQGDPSGEGPAFEMPDLGFPSF
jgi:hypothetical protein